MNRENFEAAVEAEVARRLAEQQAQFAQTMQQAIQASLQGVDAANAALEEQRRALEAEHDAAREATARAEREGDRIASEYFEKARAALIEFTQRDQLRQLARKHLESGRPVEDICQWLDVEPEFVQAIVEVIDRVADHRKQAARRRPQLDGDPRLRYSDSGRGGSITFQNGDTTFELWWEYGFGSALVIIDAPSPTQWKARTKLPLDQRADVLRFIAEQVIADRVPGASGYEIGESVITILR